MSDLTHIHEWGHSNIRSGWNNGLFFSRVGLRPTNGFCLLWGLRGTALVIAILRGSFFSLAQVGVNLGLIFFRGPFFYDLIFL